MTGPSHGRALAIGTLAVATLDMLDCIVVYGLLRGVTATQCFQGVASGLLGRDAFAGGWSTVLLGGALHLFNAAVIVTVYWLASRRVPLLARRPAFSAVLYGCFVFLVMNYVVIPVSAARVLPVTWPNMINGFLGHIVAVGLPCFVIARVTRSAESAAA